MALSARYTSLADDLTINSVGHRDGRELALTVPLSLLVVAES